MNTPTVQMKSAGLSAFSQSSKKILESNIQQIMEKGIEATFTYGETDGSQEIVQNFAKNIAPDLADAIDDYVKNMILSQMIIITPAALVSPTGPVSGVMSTTTDIVLN